MTIVRWRAVSYLGTREYRRLAPDWLVINIVVRRSIAADSVSRRASTSPSKALSGKAMPLMYHARSMASNLDLPGFCTPRVSG